MDYAFSGCYVIQNRQLLACGLLSYQVRVIIYEISERSLLGKQKVLDVINAILFLLLLNEVLLVFVLYQVLEVVWLLVVVQTPGCLARSCLARSTS
jgi:hypothetical protein